MTKKFSGLTLVITSFALIFFSCEDKSINPTTLPSDTDILEANVNDYTIIDHSYEELLNTMWSLAQPDQNPNPTDENGIEIFTINGKTYYHPLHLIQRMQWYLDSYYQTQDTFYLNWTLKYYDKLMEISTETDEYLYFNYEFDFPLHGYQDELMKAPWLSGMTQGVGLMIFTRLYKFTQNEDYLEDANKIFNSFFMAPQNHDPWITMVDAKGYLWIEEYPDHADPNYTLNGFIFCIYGLYEYYQLTRNEDALFLLKASISTIEHYIEDFRIPGDVSLYCLTHEVPSPKYHLIHTKQLRSLHLFTGEEYFKNMADSLYADYH